MEEGEKRDLEERPELEESETREREEHGRRGHEVEHGGGYMYVGHVGEAHGEMELDIIIGVAWGG